MATLPDDFIEALRLRAGNRCECARTSCHDGSGVCGVPLIHWSAVAQAKPLSEPPAPSEYLAFCGPCAARWMSKA